MCGIAGMVALNGGSVEPALLQRMNDTQAHRGPDGEGFVLAWRNGEGFQHALLPHTSGWQNGQPVKVALGHRRLAILDLSDRGLQPMTVGQAREWIVFN